MVPTARAGAGCGALARPNVGAGAGLVRGPFGGRVPRSERGGDRGDRGRGRSLFPVLVARRSLRRFPPSRDNVAATVSRSRERTAERAVQASIPREGGSRGRGRGRPTGAAGSVVGGWALGNGRRLDGRACRRRCRFSELRGLARGDPHPPPHSRARARGGGPSEERRPVRPDSVEGPGLPLWNLSATLRRTRAHAPPSPPSVTPRATTNTHETRSPAPSSGVRPNRSPAIRGARSPLRLPCTGEGLGVRAPSGTPKPPSGFRINPPDGDQMGLWNRRGEERWERG